MLCGAFLESSAETQSMIGFGILRAG